MLLARLEVLLPPVALWRPDVFCYMKSQRATIIRENQMFKWPMLAAAALAIALQPAEVRAQQEIETMDQLVNSQKVSLAAKLLDPFSPTSSLSDRFGGGAVPRADKAAGQSSPHRAMQLWRA
jgi:hypothetical protein